jgi:hypothetical protein
MIQVRGIFILFLLCFGSIGYSMLPEELPVQPTAMEICNAIERNMKGGNDWIIAKIEQFNIDIHQIIPSFLLATYVFPVFPHNLQKFTFLHLACAASNMDIVKYLLGRGEDMRVKDDFGFAPIHYVEWFPVLNKFFDRDRKIIHERSTQTQETLLQVLQRKQNVEDIQRDLARLGRIKTCIESLEYWHTKYPEQE